MTYVKPYTDGYRDIVGYLCRKISDEIREAYPGLPQDGDFPELLLEAAEMSERRFIMIIDEWDAPIRENAAMQRTYLEFLRSLFKGSGTTSRIFAAVYMTGILPIKKDGSQSAISDFEEFTMLRPGDFAPYVGFTEEEVRTLCATSAVDFGRMKQWYDGYSFRDVHSVYNPNSVMKAIRYREFASYWTETAAAESLLEYIGKGYSGLSRTVAELIGGIAVPVSTEGFSNDLTTFKSRDDVLTLLIHLGYLAYDAESGMARIPNEEIRREFSRSVREVDNSETVRRLRESDRLFEDTWNGNEEAVAGQIEKIHREETSPLHYNREESLRSVIKLAYYTYRDHYLQFEELPAGEGYADIVYLPKKEAACPALVIELKWNHAAEGAIDQIRSRKYPAALEGYGGEILLVGISYNKEAPAGQRKHHCRIETWR